MTKTSSCFGKEAKDQGVSQGFTPNIEVSSCSVTSMVCVCLELLGGRRRKA